MKSRTQDASSQFISLNKLKKSPKNVRKTPHGKGHIEALADSIAAHGQIQNLVVETEVDEQSRATGSYLVTAGEGRRLAQLLRVKRKQIKANESIRCIIDDTHNAYALSLAENELRAHMHPADQFVAFKQLVDSGESIEEVAAHFGVTPLVVQRRLKLANVAPDFLALYRKDEITLDHLMALALTDDHAKQKEVWERLPKYDRHPQSLRCALTEHEISVREAIVKFVGLKAYEKAGGLIRRDLFAERQDDGFVLDPELLRRLATDKLDKQARKLKEDGCAWVDVTPQLDYAALSAYGRVRSVPQDSNKKEQAKVDALRQEQDDIKKQAEAASEDEGRLAELADRADEIDAQIDELQEELRVPDPVQQALAGAIVSIGHDGEVRIERDLLKPEDAKRFAREGKAAEKSASSNGPRVHSAALVRRLTAHRTLALRATLAQRPDIALIALTHRLALETFFSAGYSVRSSLQIETQQTPLDQYAPDVPACKAQAAIAERAEALRAALPDDPQALFAWLLQQPQAEVLNVCAYCVALAVNGVNADEGSSVLDALATAAGLDMRDWWTPTAENYLASIPKARILDVVREAVSPEAAATLTSLKKNPLAQAAERRLAGTGWLPSPLRVHAA